MFHLCCPQKSVILKIKFIYSREQKYILHYYETIIFVITCYFKNTCQHRYCVIYNFSFFFDTHGYYLKTP